MRYKYVFFDMDGTILDTLGDLMDATNHTLSEFGFAPVDARTVAHSLGNGAAHLIRCAMTASSGKEPENELCEKVLAVYKPWYNAHSRIRTAPYPGIMDLMRNLKAAGVRMAVVSNKPDQTVQELSSLFFGDLMDASIGESLAIRKKPAADTVYEAMRRMGLPPTADADGANATCANVDCAKVPYGGFSRELLSECVYIGDTEVDIMTAENAGMDCVTVTWGFRSREELTATGAKRMVSTAEELFQIL